MITVIRTHKPTSVAATARAWVKVEGNEHTYDQVVDAGLTGLREDRSSLWGYGIEGDSFLRSSPHPVPEGYHVVYAYRD
jgi:hypothetical protein